MKTEQAACALTHMLGGRDLDPSVGQCGELRFSSGDVFRVDKACPLATRDCREAFDRSAPPDGGNRIAGEILLHLCG